MYHGELTEFDILGVAGKQDANEDSIRKALDSASELKLKRGDKVLWIQSGAMVPDDAMVEEAKRYFDIAPFSGTPPSNKEDLSTSLRLRAAQGGCPYILCYWGVLESANDLKKGAAVSWVPIVGYVVPDQKEQMRIRLKAILVDVRTGSWKMYTPESYADSRMSSMVSREKQDQKLVEDLKRNGYRTLVADLLK